MTGRNRTLAILVLAGMVVLGLGYWGYECQHTAKQIEKELRSLWMEQALVTPLLVQCGRSNSLKQVPTSFLVEEPECSRRLLAHLALKNTRAANLPQPNASDLLANASGLNESRTAAGSSP
jgi:hypothetical protein